MTLPTQPTVSYSLQDLLDIMAKLRAPEGCPWDREQTHASLLKYLIEEAYEFIDAVENRDIPNMREELGDVLLQVVFHAQLAKERGDFDFSQVAHSLSDKLVRRHPHVFGADKLADADAVVKKWEELKREEKQGNAQGTVTGTLTQASDGAVGDGGLGAANSFLSGIPKHLPALLKAEKIQKKAGQVGFDWPDYRGPMEKIREEMAELTTEAEAAQPDVARLEDEFGDLLFAVVNVGRKLKLDPERALASTNKKFLRRFARMENLAIQGRADFTALSLADKEALWIQAKGEEKSSP